MNTNPQNHIAWVDLLRIIACFLVVLAHCCDPFVGQFDNNRYEFLSGVFIGSLVRSCVPLFVMISGILLLPVRMDMRTFYSRRAKRILTPFIFWSMLAPVLYFLYLHSGISTVNPGISMEDHTLSMTLRKLYTFLFNFNYDTTPLWYVYMLLGLYLFMPILSAWLVQASARDIRCVLWIWAISMCLPYLKMLVPVLGYTGNYGNMGLWGVCDWNPYGMLYYFSGFTGYLVLAYYLVHYPLNWSWKRTTAIAIPLFLTGYAITAGGFLITQKYFPGSLANLEIIWYFSGINVALMTFAVFIIMQKIQVPASPLLSKIAGMTFGVFLCHFIFVQAGYDLIYPNIALPPFLQIILIGIFAFILSLAVIWTMSLNKFTQKMIM